MTPPALGPAPARREVPAARACRTTATRKTKGAER